MKRILTTVSILLALGGLRAGADTFVFNANLGQDFSDLPENWFLADGVTPLGGLPPSDGTADVTIVNDFSVEDHRSWSFHGLTLDEANASASEVLFGGLNLGAGGLTFLTGRLPLVANSISLTADQTWTQQPTALGGLQQVVAADLSGAATLTLYGFTDGLALRGNHGFTGNLVVDGGTVLYELAPFSNIGAIIWNNGTLSTTLGALPNNFVLNSTLPIDSGIPTLNGNISGSGGITLTNSPQVTFNGNNTFTGPVVLDGSAQITLGSDHALGVGTLTINGGTLNGNGHSLPNPVTFNGQFVVVPTAVSFNGPVTLGGEIVGENGVPVTFNGPVTLSRDEFLTSNNVLTDNPVSFNGVVSGDHSITSTSSLTLNASNTFTGGATVIFNDLYLGNNNAAGTGPINMSGHFFTTAPGLTIANPIELGADIVFKPQGALTLNGVLTEGAIGQGPTFIGGSVTLNGDSTNCDFEFSMSGTAATFGSDHAVGTGTFFTDSNLTIAGGASHIENELVFEGINNQLATDYDLTLSGLIREFSDGASVAILKGGVGTLNLTGPNTFRGGVTINGGQLLVGEAIADGQSATGVGPVTVNAGGTLGGGNASGTTGSVRGALTVNSGGAVAPGNSPGILTVNGDVVFNSGSTLKIEITGASLGTQYDQLKVNGAVSLAGANLALSGGFVGDGQILTIINNDGIDPIIGEFAGLHEGSTVFFNGVPFVISYQGGDGNDVTLRANSAPVAGANNLSRPNNNRVAKVLESALLANGSDPDGDPLTITAVGSALPVGSSVSIVGSFVVYVAPSTNSGNGSFTYTLSDGSHFVTGNVMVNETSPIVSDSLPNAAQISTRSGGFTVSFIGVAGGRYRVQYTTNASTPYTWQEFNPPGVYLAADNGVFEQTDENPPDALRLYRAILDP